MARTNQFEDINGSGMRIGVVRARFNQDITQGLLDGAMKVLTESGVWENDIVVVEVPGSYEIPVVAANLIRAGEVDGGIALGCIMKGETMHDQFLANAVFQSLSLLSIETGIPVTVGILTVNNREQAETRSGDTDMNRGREAAHTMLEMVKLNLSFQKNSEAAQE
ncbi:MAG: 6,7-dimethyl-8-ribityllumazine synthase [Parcubacteria group bacterium GW2011_GWA2_56_7]|nr:MAG: 6,7-dimethyl-8-ribityllumazine synthase [Parcubacteria group bacterium GW2011_GWA2_56_7]